MQFRSVLALRGRQLAIAGLMTLSVAASPLAALATFPPSRTVAAELVRHLPIAADTFAFQPEIVRHSPGDTPAKPL